MVDLNIKDAAASGNGGCGCGCGHDKASTSEGAGAPASGTTMTYTVEGMTCNHCVNAVTEEVEALPGVTSATVDLESGQLVVISDAPVDFDRIVEAVAEAGDYTVS